MGALRLLCLSLLRASTAVAQGDGPAGDVLALARALAEAGFAGVVQAPESATSITTSIVSDSPEVTGETGTPVVMMHGMGDFANNPMGMVPLRKLIAKEADAYVHSVELCSDKEKLSDCSSEDQKNGFFMVMDDQVDQFARVVQADEKLAGGFDAVGFSQGNTVIRGYIHRYNNPPVKKFLSMHGVLMGVNGIPQCPMNATGLGLVCRAVDGVLSHAAVYSSFVQDRLAQANYYRDAENLDEYREKGHFLPYINNEVKGKENTTYADNFKSLEKLVLVMAQDDTMVHPKESEHFGYFRDGSRTELVAMRDAPWYAEDWFGLKSLDEAKKIDFHSTPGNHLRFTEDFLAKMVRQYFAPARAASILM